MPRTSGYRSHAPKRESRICYAPIGKRHGESTTDRGNILIDALRELVAGEQVLRLRWGYDDADNKLARTKVLLLITRVQTLKWKPSHVPTMAQLHLSAQGNQRWHGVADR